MGDDRKVTLEILEGRLAAWDRRIADWKPTNAWDAANQRPLKHFKKQRASVLKAIDRLEIKNREIEHESLAGRYSQDA